ncbi:MAG: hypothetical protein ACK47F_14245 [Flavobacteriales bacterium]|jgi:hypothetical protein
MAIQKRFKTLIFILLIITSFYFLWVMGLKEILHNYWTRSVQISDLAITKEVHLKKFDAQNTVYGLELEISGSSNRNITLLFGPDKGKYQQEALLKKGIINYDFSSEWNDQDCFIYLDPSSGAKANLKINYRFYGSTK